MIRQTSILAYQQIEAEGTMGKQSLRIYAFLRERYPKGFTRNELSRELRIRINAICGRINELLAARWLEEVGKKYDEFSNKQNMVVRCKNG